MHGHVYSLSLARIDGETPQMHQVLIQDYPMRDGALVISQGRPSCGGSLHRRIAASPRTVRGSLPAVDLLPRMFLRSQYT